MVRSPQTDERLLTIKEAAAKLRVSEVSLRRWTDRGELPCLRIGGRRERRFRPADIEAFARRGEAPAPAGPTAASAVSLSGLDIPRGSHLCAFYASTEGRDKLALPFLQGGLRDGERCFLVAAPRVRDEILRALARLDPSLDDALARGALQTHAPGAAPAHTLAFFRARFASATREGWPGLRVLGDMAGFLDAGATRADLVAFEAEFDRALAHKYPVVSLCQYDARAFTGVDIVHALEVHGDLYDHPLRYFLGA